VAPKTQNREWAFPAYSLFEIPVLISGKKAGIPANLLSSTDLLPIGCNRSRNTPCIFPC
jgi:hypothetical protein